MSENNLNKHLHVEFYVEPVKNERASSESGRPVFDDVEMVKIKIAGDKNNVFVARAHDGGSVYDKNTGYRLTYADQFSEHYEHFKKNAEFHGSGSPLEAIGLSPAKIAELNTANVYTVEALASLDGTFLQKLGMGARDLKKKAEEFLARSTDNAAINRLEDENAELRARLDRMEKLFAGQSAPLVEPAPDAPVSPFADYDADTIRVWLEDHGAPAPHHNTGLPKLIQIADEWNEKLKSPKAA